MNLNEDLKKIAVLMIVLSLGCGLLGSAVGILVYSRYYVPPITPQWMSRLHRLKIDGNADVVQLTTSGHTTQTSNIFEVTNSSDLTKFIVDNDGNVEASGTLSVTGGITFAGDIAVVNIDASGYVSATAAITSATSLASGGLTSGRVVVASTNGLLSDDSDLTFATDTLTVTNVGAYTATGAINFDSQNMTNVDIDSGTIDGATIGSSSAAAGAFTTIDASGATELDGGLTVDDTAFTVADVTGNTVISGTLTVTDTSDFIGNIADSGGDLTIADDVDITLGLDVQGGSIVLQNDEEIQNDVNGTVTLHIAGADEWDFTADQLDATLGQIVNVGAAGTDFSGTGGLTLADALTISSGGADVTGNSTIAGTLTVTDTSDLQGSVADSGGDFTIADDTVITGTLDVQGINQDLNTENIGVLPTVLSIDVITTTDGAIATVGAGEIWIIHAVYFKTTTNFDCTGDDCTLIVGDGNDDDGFLYLVDAEMQTTIQEIAGGAAGWTGMGSGTVGSYLSAIAKIGFVYDGAETIDIKIEDNSDNSDPTAGAGTLYILYTRIQ